MISSKMILVVDDDIDYQRILQCILEASGYRVRCASGMEEALEQMRQDKPDMVITDLMMQSLDAGFSLSRRIKADARLADVPVIIVTAIGRRRGLDFSPQGSDELAAMGADAYFDKPVEPEALLGKVAELLQLGSREDSA